MDINVARHQCSSKRDITSKWVFSIPALGIVLGFDGLTEWRLAGDGHQTQEPPNAEALKR
jgi:hypothetical protein